MIKQCLINMECRLERIVDFPSHDVFVGDIVETYADESVLSFGKVDVSKLNPLLFDMASKKYWAIGDEIANCWSIGKQVKDVKN
jgi:flavin reductase (DIM6/NTAB) family NADH-FMN oxidoreductase RutF